MKGLTWDELATLYSARTGRPARTQGLDAVFNWAITQEDIETNEDGSLSMKGDKNDGPNE